MNPFSKQNKDEELTYFDRNNSYLKKILVNEFV